MPPQARQRLQALLDAISYAQQQLGALVMSCREQERRVEEARTAYEQFVRFWAEQCLPPGTAAAQFDPTTGTFGLEEKKE